jgi:hypothetical protein
MPRSTTGLDPLPTRLAQSNHLAVSARIQDERPDSYRFLTTSGGAPTPRARRASAWFPPQAVAAAARVRAREPSERIERTSYIDAPRAASSSVARTSPAMTR